MCYTQHLPVIYEVINFLSLSLSLATSALLGYPWERNRINPHEGEKKLFWGRNAVEEIGSREKPDETVIHAGKMVGKSHLAAVDGT